MGGQAENGFVHPYFANHPNIGRQDEKSNEQGKLPGGGSQFEGMAEDGVADGKHHYDAISHYYDLKTKLAQRSHGGK